MTRIVRDVLCTCVASVTLLACVDRAGVAITSPPDASADSALGDGDGSADDAPSDDGAPLLQLPPMHAIHGNAQLICAGGDGAIYLKRPSEPWSAVVLPDSGQQGEIEQISWRGVFCPSADQVIAVGFGAADMVPTRGRVIEFAVPRSGAPPTAVVFSFESLLEAVHGAGDVVVAVGASIDMAGENEAGVITRLDASGKVIWTAVALGDMPAHQGLGGVWVTETQERIAVGNDGVVLQRQAAAGGWSKIPPSWPTQMLRGVWSWSNGKRAVAVGRGILLEREGSGWSDSSNKVNDAIWNAVYGTEGDEPVEVVVGDRALAVFRGVSWTGLTDLQGLDLANTDLRGVWISQTTGLTYLVGSRNGGGSGILARCDGLADADAVLTAHCALLSRP